MSPHRIQRKRTKGWKMPPGAVYVGRPTRWGNPFWHAERFYGLDLSLALYRNMVHGMWDPSLVADLPLTYYEDHHGWLRRINGHPIEVARFELGGRDLVCWCPLDQPCHADVLLKVANSGVFPGMPIR